MAGDEESGWVCGAFNMRQRPSMYYTDRLKMLPEERVWPGLVALAVGALAVAMAYGYIMSLLFSGQGC